MDLFTSAKQYSAFTVTDENLADAEALGLADSPVGSLIGMVVVQTQDSMRQVQVIDADSFARDFTAVPTSDSPA